MEYSTLISAENLFAILDDDNLVLVDCRFDLSNTSWGFEAYKDGHIPGSVYAHLDKDLCGGPATDNGRHPLPTPKELTDLFSRFGIHSGVQVVVYDDSGGAFASRLWWMLRYLNHDKAAVLDGGLSTWIRAGYPLRRGIETNPPAIFNGQPQKGQLVLMDEVPTLATLVDSRAPERYQGESEPLDPVAGHIPGAVNYYYQNNWDDNGNFLQRDVIRNQFEDLLKQKVEEELTFYCGSGVTACVNILAYEHAGLGKARLYVGSWGEWCRTPGRPVASLG